MLEVIIALAVFGFLIGGRLALLPWGVEGAGNVRDRNMAYGMTDAIQVELELMGFGLVEALTAEDKYLDLVAPAVSPKAIDTSMTQATVTLRFRWTSSGLTRLWILPFKE